MNAVRKHIAGLTAWSLIVSSAFPIVGAQAPASPGQATTPSAPAKAAPGKTPPAKASATSAAAATDIDGGWPRVFNSPRGALFLLYQPQIASWKDQKHMVAYIAVSYTAKGTSKPALGTLTLEAETSVAVPERLVSFSDLEIKESHFPTLKNEEVRVAVDQIKAGMPKEARVIALDRVLASVDKSQIVPNNVEGLKAEPPVVFYSNGAALLVNIDGDPVWSPIKDNNLKFAVNTNWDLFQLESSKTFYLRYEHSWLQAASIDGPWKAAGKLPDSFRQLPPDDNWKDVKAALPGKPLSGQAPKVFVSTKPAELILVSGAPTYLLVEKTGLLWVSNTDSDLFRLGKGGPLYFLVSGRWFAAPDFTGPWTFATPSLPADFQKIPLEHPRSRVLASVPGTSQAAEAVLLAQIKETATVNKKSVKAPEVAFDGQPKFDAIPSTTVSRASNTDKEIIKAGDLFYMCFEGVWFVSKSPSGPWEVTGQVPSQIYEIPPSSPSYPVTQVIVVENNNDAAVYATAAAYTGMMVAWGCVVWGSGYYYPPYVGYGGFYPRYYPFYPTYGFHASYNPWTGAYGRGAVAYGPYGGAGVGARYNPRTGTYARGAAAWGPYGARGAATAYNPRTGAVGGTRQGSGVYGSWGQTGVSRGDQWATSSRVTNNVTGATTRRTQTSGGGTAVTRNGAGVGNNSGVARTGNGDMYAGRDGNVYRNTGNGWEQAGNGGWNSVPGATPQQREQAVQRANQPRQSGGSTPTAGTAAANPTVGQLNRDSAARAEGAQRTKDAGTVNRGSSGVNSGSYKPSTSSGSGMRSAPRGGGGGRRR